MKIALLVDLPNIGKAGDIKEVSAGYANNFLIPNNKAVPANKCVLVDIARKKSNQSQRHTRQEIEVKEIATSIEGRDIVIIAKAGSKGRLYGSITNTDVAVALQSICGHVIDKRKLEIEKAIRSIGSYGASYKPLPGITAAFTVTVQGKESQ